ncbi:MAG: hypothetical protein L0Z53_06850 [Acidobacteriales bacterium]|nr:hypothetical protein [Terriglobales bacterium]
MTPENEALVADAKALVREARHVKRFAGVTDFVAQLCSALEHSEARREELEQQLAARRVYPPTVVAVHEKIEGPAPYCAEEGAWNAS